MRALRNLQPSDVCIKVAGDYDSFPSGVTCRLTSRRYIVMTRVPSGV